MTTFNGTTVNTPTTNPNAGSAVRQMFCTVNDLVEDQQTAGASESRWYQSILSASDYLQKEIGWFVPVRMARYFNGAGKTRLWVPPLLSIVSISNDSVALSASDYVLGPNGRHWEHGPHTYLDVYDDSSNLSCWVNADLGVALDGFWGLYNKQASTGARGASNQSDIASSLVVSDGGKVSPGMVL